MKILVIKLSSIGDLFRALPAVHNLKTTLQAEIHWVTQPENKTLVECFDDVSKVIVFPRRSILKGLKEFKRQLQMEKYDYIIDFQGLLKSAFVGRIAKGKRRIGPSFQREGAFLFYDDVAGKKNKNRHSVDECYDIIDFLGLKKMPAQFPITLPKYNLPASKSPKIAIAPVSRWESKNWPIEFFIKSAEILIEQIEASVFLIGSPADKKVCDKIKLNLKGRCINLAGKTTLVESASVLDQMDFLIANDSGPVHIACALGTKSYVIYGPTSALRTGPYGNSGVVLQTNMECIPCYKRKCRFGDKRCMLAITPEFVANKVINDWQHQNS